MKKVEFSRCACVWRISIIIIIIHICKHRFCILFLALLHIIFITIFGLQYLRYFVVFSQFLYYIIILSWLVYLQSKILYLQFSENFANYIQEFSSPTSHSWFASLQRPHLILMITPRLDYFSLYELSIVVVMLLQKDAPQHTFIAIFMHPDSVRTFVNSEKEICVNF